jgi:hypothetical protein
MARKKLLNKRAVIIASSLVAIPLTAVLIAAVTHRGRRKSLQTSRFLGQTRSKMSLVITGDTHSRQQNVKSEMQQQSPWKGSDTKITAASTTTGATTVSTNEIVDDKDIVTTPGEVPSPKVSSGIISDSAAIASSSQTQREEEISVSDEAKKAGESVKELLVTAIKEARDSAKGTGKRLKQQTIDVATTVDSKDTHSLEDSMNPLVTLFEETMTEIRKESYNRQIELLESYKDLLRTHIKVVNARRKMASKLKPGA